MNLNLFLKIEGKTLKYLFCCFRPKEEEEVTVPLETISENILVRHAHAQRDGQLQPRRVTFFFYFIQKSPP